MVGVDGGVVGNEVSFLGGNVKLKCLGWIVVYVMVVMSVLWVVYVYVELGGVLMLLLVDD